MTRPRPRLLVLNDPHPMRISRELAEEIGYNESVVLLQLEYLISISTTQERDGDLWTYQSLDDLRSNFFPWWSTATIWRVLKSLEAKRLIKIGNYNRLGMDRTQWFALDEEGISGLTSVKLDLPIFQNEKWERNSRRPTPNQPELMPENPPEEPPIFQNETPIFQNEKCIFQNETTIPEIPTEIPTKTSKPKERAEFPNENPGAGARAPAGPRNPEPPEILIFREVTGRRPTRDQRALVIETIRENGFTAADLQVYWREWSARGYNPLSLPWLLEWAVQGSIPVQAGRASSRRTSNTDDRSRYLRGPYAEFIDQPDRPITNQQS